LAEIEAYGIARSLFLSGMVLHLLYESAPLNQRMKLSARGGRFEGNRSVLAAAAAGRSLCAIR
jgi:hypothetical protein